MDPIEFDRYWKETFPNFSRKEMACKETGEEGMDLGFMRDLQVLRNIYDKPMAVSSAYRSPKHSVEAKKETPGEHCEGLAVDLIVPMSDFLFLSHHWYDMGYRRVGWGSGFIHLGGSKTRPQTVWTY